MPSRVNVLRALLIWLVRRYQRHVSPYKGFVCAHRVLHGGPSCSEFVVMQLQHAGVLSTVGALPRRSRACYEASCSLSESEPGDKGAGHNKQNDTSDALGCMAAESAGYATCCFLSS